MENISFKHSDNNKSYYHIVDKRNFHEKLYHFQNLLRNQKSKILIMNIVDSRNFNFSKIYQESNFSQSRFNFIDEEYIPNLIKKNPNSQILFLEINIVTDQIKQLTSNSSPDKDLHSEIFLIPSLKFHKFINESFLNFNPSVLNFLNQNKNIFSINDLFSVDSLSYMPKYSEESFDIKFDKIKKYGKPTKNEFKKSYYFYPKGLYDPITQSKNHLKDFFICFNDNLLKIKSNESSFKNSSLTEKYYFKDNFSIDKVLNFSYMNFFKFYDEKFINLKFSKFSLVPQKNKDNINLENLLSPIRFEFKEFIQVKYINTILKKVYLDFDFIEYKLITKTIGKTNEKLEKFYNDDYKHYSKHLQYNIDNNENNKEYEYFSVVGEDENFNNLKKSGFINEKFYSSITEFLSQILNGKILTKFESNEKYLEINYILKCSPSQETAYYIQILKYVIRKFVLYFETSFLILCNNDLTISEINIGFEKIFDHKIKTFKICSREFLKEEYIAKKDDTFQLNLDEILSILKYFYEIEDDNKLEFSYKAWEKIELLIPKKLFYSHQSEYEITVNYNLSLLPKIEPKKMENISYEILFLKTNKEKEILFDYDIETAVYKFLEFVLSSIKNNSFNDPNFIKMTNEMKKFYFDLQNFIELDDNENFKKDLEGIVFQNKIYDFTFQDKISFKYERNNLPEMISLAIQDDLKGMLEKKNEILQLFYKTKSKFLKREEFGIQNFIEELFNIANDNVILCGIDMNSIISKIICEIYVDNNSCKDGLKKSLIEKLKNKFFSFNYLDINYLFNNNQLMKNFGFTEKDFMDIINVYLNNPTNNNKIKINQINTNQNKKLITLAISEFLRKKFFVSNKFDLISKLIEFFVTNRFLNRFYIGKKLNFSINKKLINYLEINRKDKILTPSCETENFDVKEKIGNSIIIKYDEKKRKIVIDYLKKICDFYIHDLRNNTTKIDIIDEIEENTYKNIIDHLNQLNLIY